MKITAFDTPPRSPHLVDFVEPVLIGRQFGHEGLVLLPPAVQIPCPVVRGVLSGQHLLVYPQGELREGRRLKKRDKVDTWMLNGDKEWIPEPQGGSSCSNHRYLCKALLLLCIIKKKTLRLECSAGSAEGLGCLSVSQKPPGLCLGWCRTCRDQGCG